VALTREDVYVNPATGIAEELPIGRAAAWGFIVLGRDRQPRDLTDDTLAVVAKTADAAVRTLSFTKDANQATTGKGKCTLAVDPATAGIDAGDADKQLNIDLLVNNRVRKALKIMIRDSEAD
jgi:hypothetical protein